MRDLGERAFPVILAAPSGTGKTTIARALVEGSERFVFSISATTRPPRADERHGRDYYFVDEERFEEMIREDELVEWARVHGHHYGTPRHNLDEAAEEGRHVVLDIDVQGARQIREKLPEALLVFIFPPSARALHDRLTGRDTEVSGEVAQRLRNARDELARAVDFDYVVVNDDLEEAVREVRTIVDAEGLRPDRALDLDADVARLRAEIDELIRSEYAR